MEYIFTLKYQLDDHDSDVDVLLERLGSAGCDDALVGVGQAGRLALEFTREAPSVTEAVRSALADIKGAIPTARFIEMSPDLVGLTDVADIVGISRQAMRKLMLAHRAAFPLPVHEGTASLWHLAEVLDWLKARGGYEFDAGMREAAHIAMEVNTEREVKRCHALRQSGSLVPCSRVSG
jgi:predicted DNA-binding transcriptional regulator AlpA